jgi:NADH pyrophosphatase NudC (nudix superfamily)
MASQRQKEKKKKERQKASKAKVLVRREQLRKDRKEAAEEQRKEKEAHAIIHGRQKPFVKTKTTEFDPLTEISSIKDMLENNLKILEALEQEYDAEQAARADVNEKLEAEGHMSMREKMDALHQKALEITGKAEELAAAKESAVQ